MNVLVVNCGSSSLKFQLINYDNRDVMAKGLCERIGIDGRLVYEPKNGEKEVTEAAMPSHTEAIQMVLDALVNEKSGVIKSLEEIDAIGHRVLHGGMKITQPVIIDEEVIKVIEECADLGPLHNPANLMGINACMKLMPGVPSLFYGDECSIQGITENEYRQPMPWDKKETLSGFIQTLIKIRVSYVDGETEYRPLWDIIGDGVFAFLRTGMKGILKVIVNAGENPFPYAASREETLLMFSGYSEGRHEVSGKGYCILYIPCS